jgi:hypothetical protein
MSLLARVRPAGRYVRAALITFMLALCFVAGWPGRIPKMVRNWREPWRSLALRVPPLQGSILAPFAPIATTFGVYSEDWPLFTGTGGIRYRMWVEGQDKKGRYTLLYRADDAAHRYLAGPLEYRRTLNLWNPHHDYISDGYPEFAHWLARRAFRDFRRYQRVRVRMEEVRIRAHGAGYVPTGRFVHEVTTDRAEARP